MPVAEKTELVTNAAGRPVLEIVNRRAQTPYLGLGKYRPTGTKASPPIRTAADYPENGDKVVADLETALRKCGLRDGMVLSSHLARWRPGSADDVECRRQARRQRSGLVPQRVFSLSEIRD